MYKYTILHFLLFWFVTYLEESTKLSYGTRARLEIYGGNLLNSLLIKYLQWSSLPSKLQSVIMNNVINIQTFNNTKTKCYSISYLQVPGYKYCEYTNKHFSKYTSKKKTKYIQIDMSVYWLGFLDKTLVLEQLYFRLNLLSACKLTLSHYLILYTFQSTHHSRDCQSAL